MSTTAPPYLHEIGDDDARWLHEHGELTSVSAGTVVITEGVALEHLWVVLEGEFRVTSEQLRDPDILRVGPGELLGEVSYIQREPAGASVIAVVDGVLLALRRDAIDEKIRDDPAFGSRFRKVLMQFAVNRMWRYNRRDLKPPPKPPEPDPYADLRVHEIIEKLLRGDV